MLSMVDFYEWARRMVNQVHDGFRRNLGGDFAGDSPSRHLGSLGHHARLRRSDTHRPPLPRMR